MADSLALLIEVTIVVQSTPSAKATFCNGIHRADIIPSSENTPHRVRQSRSQARTWTKDPGREPEGTGAPECRQSGSAVAESRFGLGGVKMNQITLEEYRCRKCHRLFYIDPVERHPLDLDFGCPYGCDDNGDRFGEIRAERNVVTTEPATRIKDHRITIELSEDDFEGSMGRRPQDQAEFDQWAALAEKGLLNGHIDWSIIRDCTREAMQGRGDENE